MSVQTRLLSSLAPRLGLGFNSKGAASTLGMHSLGSSPGTDFDDPDDDDT
jgi:hypothetical protein